jgi:hypothetical protein
MYFGDFIGGILAGSLGEHGGPSEIRDALTGDVIRQRTGQGDES